MEKPKSRAKLRDFIRSREMRYFAVMFSGQVHIRKAFKVEIDGGEYWIHFTADGTDVIPERKLVKTMKEAKEEAKKLRDSLQQEKIDYDNKLKDVSKFLSNYSWQCHEYPYYSNNKFLRPEEQSLAGSVKMLYYTMPGQEKDDKNTYIDLLENYIKYGTIYTQGKSFRKEHVVCVRYGEDGAVQIELINGTTITPKSSGVTKLIKAIFGDNKLDYWYDTRVKLPTDNRDLIEKLK